MDVPSIIPEQVKLTEVTVYIIRSSWTANKEREYPRDEIGAL
jgi:hypothetical protein